MVTKVRARCVKIVLARATRGGDDADSVAAVAERAGKSPRTIYRILDYADEKLMALDLADRVLIAANGLLSLDCDEDVVENA